MERARLGLYKHFKGSVYRVIGVARHTERGEELVVYTPHDDSNTFYARLGAMFTETVSVDGQRVKRFTRLDDA